MSNTPYEIQMERIASGYVGNSIVKAEDSNQMSPEQLSKIARRLSHEELERTSKMSPHEHHRTAAHNEINRRTNEEANAGMMEDKMMDNYVEDEGNASAEKAEKRKKKAKDLQLIDKNIVGKYNEGRMSKREEAPKDNKVQKAREILGLLSPEAEDEIEKARSGTYVDSPQNRKLGRVGQQYGGKKKEEEPAKDKVPAKEEGKDKKDKPKYTSQSLQKLADEGVISPKEKDDPEVSEEENELQERADEYGLEVEELQEIEDEVGSEITGMYGDDTYEFDDGSEWRIFDSEEDARGAARESLEQLVDDMGVEAFSPEFAENYQIITDTDKRLLAGDLQESDRDMVDDEVREEMGEDADEDEIDAEVESRLEDRYEEHMAGLERDPRDYLVNELGIYSDEDYNQASFVRTDESAMIDDAIDIDGIAHTLASYDGNEVETSGGKFMYRHN